MNPVELKYSPAEVVKRLRRVSHEARTGIANFNQGNFEQISPQDIRRLFELYDRFFLDNYFDKTQSGRIFFDLSMRMTNAGGKITIRKNSDGYTITLSAFLLFKTFKRDKRDITVNGRICKDRLEAVMRILEHEIVHLIELITYGESRCKQPRFQDLAYRLFLHTDTSHQLVTQREAACRDFHLHIGDTVEFDFQGDTCQGVITGIRKRATVMILDKQGDYRDARGNKYKKFYVPLQLLRQVKMVTEKQS